MSARERARARARVSALSACERERARVRISGVHSSTISRSLWPAVGGGLPRHTQTEDETWLTQGRPWSPMDDRWSTRGRPKTDQWSTQSVPVVDPWSTRGQPAVFESFEENDFQLQHLKKLIWIQKSIWIASHRPAWPGSNWLA